MGNSNGVLAKALYYRHEAGVTGWKKRESSPYFMMERGGLGSVAGCQDRSPARSGSQSRVVRVPSCKFVSFENQTTNYPLWHLQAASSDASQTKWGQTQCNATLIRRALLACFSVSTISKSPMHMANLMQLLPPFSSAKRARTHPLALFLNPT